jgi:uncharacterized protein YegL
MYIATYMNIIFNCLKKYKTLAFLASLLVLGITSSYAKELPIGNDKSLPANVFFMLDTSGSMAWVVDRDYIYPSNILDSRIEKAKAVIKDVVSNPAFKDKANFGLMEWNSGVNESVSEVNCNYYSQHYVGGDRTKTSYPPYITKTCGERLDVPISITGSSDILNMLNQLVPGGGTNLDAAMLLARSYLQSTNSPVNTALNCQKNIIILISDGDWTGTQALGIVKDFNSSNIKTYAIGFSSGATNQNNYNDIAKAGGSGTPYFVQDSSQLSAVLNTVLTSVTEVPQTLQQVSGKDALIKASFLPVNNHQWKGYLKKQRIDGSGNFVDVWEAGSLLNSRSYTDRKVWTALEGLATSTNNFVEANSNLITNALYPNLATQPQSADVKKLINFVRGADAYEEFGGSRWKLGDIYHSKPVLVAAPSDSYSTKNTNTEAAYRASQGYSSFVAQWAARKSVVYAGGNDGMLHAFDALTGTELWTFVPPPMLAKLNNMNAGQAGLSNTIYGIDGSPQAKDVFFQGAWHSILVCGLGRGGKAYFALDVTDPDSPKSLYAFENDSLNQQVFYWDATGKKYSYSYNALATLSNFDYAKLGEAWSDPTFVLMPVGGVQRWVFVIGSGYAGFSTNTIGAAAFVVDVSSGQLIKRLDLNNASGSDFANGVMSQMTKVSADDYANANFKGAILYFVDLQSKLWKLNLSDKDELYHLEKVSYATSTLSNDRLSFSQLASIDVAGLRNLYLMFGTGNLLDASRISDSISNRLFAVRDKDFPAVTNADGAYPLDSSLKLKDLSQGGGQCSTSYDRGWYLNLNGYKDSAGADIGNNWRVLNTPLVYQQKIYLEIYQPNQGNPCAAGTTRLILIDLLCGNMMVSSTVINGAADQIFFYNGNLYLTTVNDKLTNVSNIPDIKKFVTTYNPSKKTPIKFRVRVH